MEETPLFFHQLEWPAPGTRVAGPIVWLRGWLVGKPGFNFVDVRALCSTGTHAGVLGLPRIDLAQHFKSSQRWLPAEYIIGVQLPDGPAGLVVEAMDESGNWHRVQSFAVTVGVEGAESAGAAGEITNHAGRSSTRREPHLPFHGHLDEAEAPVPVHTGRIGLFGWLLHETQVVRCVFASLDGRVFNTLESGLADESLAENVTHLPAARHARFRGAIDAPPTLFSPACLRVYAELADGSVHLCFARRISLGEETIANTVAATATPRIAEKFLPTLSSGRPRRLLAIVRSLQPDDATLRALDALRHLTATTQWAARVVASEDGPLRRAFEAAECPVQIVDPREFFASSQPENATHALQKIGREIWWKHLDGVALFDPGSTWASLLATENRLPVFADPAESLAWAAPTPIFRPDGEGVFIAPIRGVAAHGASVLLHAANWVGARAQTRPIHVADVRETTEEILFRSSQQMNLESAHLWSCGRFGKLKVPSRSRDDPAAVGERTATAGSPWLQAVTGETVLASAGLICPAFEAHPHRALLSALAAGVPVVSTPSPLMAATLGSNEMTLIPPGNPLALANAVTDLLANPVARERRSAAAVRVVHDEFSAVRQLPRWRAMMEAAFRA
jgi:hypothetical protein